MAKLTHEEAKELFLKQIENQYSDEALDIIKKYKKKLEDRKKDEAREIILKSIQQYA
jgi:hypothetical protein